MFKNNENEIEQCKKLIEEYRKEGLKKSGFGKYPSVAVANNFLEKLKKNSENKLTPLNAFFDACEDYHQRAKNSEDNYKADLEQPKNVLNEDVKNKRRLRKQLYIDLVNIVISDERLKSLAKFRMENRTEKDHQTLQTILSGIFSPFKELNGPSLSETDKEKVFEFFLNAPGWDEAKFQEELKKLGKDLLPSTSKHSEQKISLKKPALSHFAPHKNEAGCPYSPSAPEMSDEEAPPPPYSAMSQSRQSTMFSQLRPVINGMKTESPIQGGPNAPLFIPTIQSDQYLRDQLKTFQTESNNSNQNPINGLAICREIASDLESSYQSNNIIDKTGGITVRQFNKEHKEKLASERHIIQQPFKSMSQFQKNTFPVLMQNVNNANANSWDTFMQSRVFCGYNPENHTKINEFPLKEWICSVFNKRKMWLDEQKLLGDLKENCLKAAVFLPPVDYNTKGEKAVITCQGIKGNKDSDRYINMVLQHHKDESGKSFYSLVKDSKVKILKNAYGHESLVTDNSYITVNPVSNELLAECLQHHKKALDNLINQHYLIFSIELENNDELKKNLSSPFDMADDDLQSDGARTPGALIARGACSPKRNILSDMKNLPVYTEKLNTFTDSAEQHYHILSAHMTILKCETLSIAKEDILNKESIDKMLKESIERLVNVTGLTGSFVHERKAEFRKFITEHPNNYCPQQSFAPR